jgi:hypothetical protein
MAPCCCWVMHRWWLVQPLPTGVPTSPGKVDNKLKRRHLATQHATRPVATPWPPPPSTALRLQNIISQLMLPWATTPNPWRIILPRATLLKGRVLHRCFEVLHHQGPVVLHHYISWVNILSRWVLICQEQNLQIIYWIVVWKERKGERIQQPI